MAAAPRTIYCDPSLASSFTPLTSLISGHLAYWLSHNPSRWERRQDFAELFVVSDATVKRQRKHLEQIFHITRTTMIMGNQKVPGANQYALRAEYGHLKWAKKNAPAIKSNIVPFPLSFAAVAASVNGEKPNIDLAWFLCGLSRVMHANGITSASFKNWKALESWTQTPPRTARRYLEQAAEAGLITLADASRPALDMTEQGRLQLLEPFVELAEEIRQARNAARMNGMIDSMAKHIGGHPDTLVDWYENLSIKDMGESLLDHHAQNEEMFDERGRIDTDRAYDSLAGI